MHLLVKAISTLNRGVSGVWRPRWERIATTNSTSNLKARRKVLWGGNKFVAITYSSGVLEYSYNGLNWVEVSVTFGAWSALAYDTVSGYFVAICYNSTLAMYSTNGINWTNTTIPTGFWYSLTFQFGKFIAGSVVEAPNTYLEVSEMLLGHYSFVTNGINISRAGLSSGFGNGKLIAFANNNSGRYSLDGLSWVDISLPFSVRGAVYAAGKWVIVGHDGNVGYSTDNGVTWVTSKLGRLRGDWRDIIFTSNHFVTISDTLPICAVSKDGIKWAVSHRISAEFEDPGIKPYSLAVNSTKLICSTSVNEMFFCSLPTIFG